MTVCKSWLLDRYAKCVSSTETLVDASNRHPGKWTHITNDSNPNLQISFVDSSRLMVSSSPGESSLIHENLTVFDASKWLRVACRGDTCLFIYKVKNETRRFRIRFSAHTPGIGNSKGACQDFISTMSPYIPIKEVPISDNDSQMPMDDSQVFSSSQVSTPSGTPSNPAAPVASEDYFTVSELSKKTLSGARDLPRAYQNTNLPTSQLNTFIRLCLTDPNFPAFVEAVEQELKKIVSEDA